MIADTINSMKQHIEDAYGIVEEKGGTIPSNKNLENMADSIGTITGGGGETPEIFTNKSFFDSTDIYNGLAPCIKFLPRSFIKQLSDNFATTNYQYVCHRLFSGLHFYDGVLDLRDLDTSKSTDMSYMFQSFVSNNSVAAENNSSIIFPENFGSACTNMSYMFNACMNLKELDLTNFNTSNVTSMNSMLSSCRTLTELDLSEFNTEKVTNMVSMFAYCTKLQEITFSENFGSACTSMSNMFQYISNGIDLDLSNFNTSNVTNMGTMFSASTINSIIFPKNFGSACTSMSSMFYTAKLPDNFATTNFNTSNVTNMSGMFNSVSNIIKLDLSGLNTSKVTNMNNMLNGMPYMIEEITFSENFGSACTNMSYMFSKLSTLAKSTFRKLDLTSFDTSKVTNMSSMFANTNYLALLDLSSFDFTKVTSQSSMFSSCGTSCLQSDGAYANKIPYIIVKDATAQNWVLTKSNGRPTTWSTANVVIKGSADDPTLGD